MTQIYLQPVDENSINYDKTIKKKLTEKDSKFIMNNSEIEFSKETDRFWGVNKYTEKQKISPNNGRWEALNPGDIILFFKKNILVACATFTVKCDSTKISQHFWKSDDYRLLYFFNNVIFPKNNITMHHVTINLLGYSNNYGALRGFTRVRMNVALTKTNNKALENIYRLIYELEEVEL